MKLRKSSSVGFEFIVVLAVTIIFALIYILFLKDFRIFGEGLEDYTICKNSNIENAKLRLKISNLVLQERKGNKCKTEYLTVSKNKELEIISKKMALCWDMYLEGKEELFETEDNNYCAICSVLDFEDKKQLSGLTDYLINHKAVGKEKTYYQYLTRTVVTNDVKTEIENSDLNKLHTIDTKKSLATIFIMGKDVNPGSLVGESKIVTVPVGTSISAVGGVSVLLGFGLCGTFVGCSLGAFLIAAGGGATGYLIGSNYEPNLDTRVLLFPYTKEDLSQLQCTMLEGKDRLDIKKF